MAMPMPPPQQPSPGPPKQQEFLQFNQGLNNQQAYPRSSPSPPPSFQSPAFQQQQPQSSAAMPSQPVGPQTSQQYQYQPQPPHAPTQSSSFSPPPYYEPTQNSSTKVDDSSFAFKTPDPFYRRALRYTSQRYQLLLDASTPHWAARWTFSLVILLIFMARIVLAQGWYVICYGLSIYYLNLFIGFLSPKIDPAFAASSDDFDDISDTGPMLPTRANDEFRPFIRRLPEFKFWLSATTATLISLFLSLFEVFDLPVFWPILLLYFILLFISTMRQQIRHMIKYGYVPWDKGKKKYGQNRATGEDTLFSNI